MQKKVTVKFKIQDLGDSNFHILLKAKIGSQPINLVLDTGASHSCLDLNFMQDFRPEKILAAPQEDNINVGVGADHFDSKMAIIDDFKVGRLKINAYFFVLLDLKHITNAYEMIDLRPIHGMLGSDFLVQYNAIIDYGNRTLTLQYDN